MNLESLASLVRDHRFLSRGVDPASAAIQAVPALADGLVLGPEPAIPGHALDALAPAAERLITTVFAEAEAASSSNPDEDPFVATLRDLISFGAVISPAGADLALLQAARATIDAIQRPSPRLVPIVGRMAEGSAENRGAFNRAVAHGVVSRVVSACSAAAAAGWRMPAYAEAMVACPAAWIFGRGSLDADPQLAMLSSMLGTPVPATTIAHAEAAVRHVVGEVIARRAARKSKAEDHALLLRSLSPEVIDGGVDTATRAILTDPDAVAVLLPQLSRYTDARALAKAGVDKAAAEHLLRVETGVAVASALVDIATALRRWDVHSLLIHAVTRVDARAAIPLLAHGPRRRVLQAAVVAVAGRAGAGGDRPYGRMAPPAGALVSDHGAIVFVVFAGPVEACRYALDVAGAVEDKASVGVGFGRLQGGTDGQITRLDGPAVQGAVAALRLGRVGVAAGAADELVQIAPVPKGQLPEGRLGCRIDEETLSLELVPGVTGVFELLSQGAPVNSGPVAPPRPSPVPAPIRVTAEPGEGRAPEIGRPRIEPIRAPEPVEVRRPEPVRAPEPEVRKPEPVRAPEPEVRKPEPVRAPEPEVRKPEPVRAPPMPRIEIEPEIPRPPVLRAPEAPAPRLEPRTIAPPAMLGDPFADLVEALPPAPADELPELFPEGGDPFVVAPVEAPVAPAPAFDTADNLWDESPTTVQRSPAAQAPVEDFFDLDAGSFDLDLPPVPVHAELDASEATSPMDSEEGTAPRIADEEFRVPDELRPDAPVIDLGMDDFSFDLGISPEEEGAGRKVAAPAAKVGFGFERVDDEATHLERLPEEVGDRGTWSDAPAHSFDMELEDEASDHPAAPPVFAVIPEPPAPVTPPPAPVARRNRPAALDFEHLFRGYCFYLDSDRAVFGRPYGARIVDRHAYDYNGDVEAVYRAFLKDKITEGFVPQTELAAEVPVSTTLLPLNMERLSRAWSSLT